MAGSKNNPANKGATQKNLLVTSDICEKCNTQCPKGIKYLESMKNGKFGHGCVCYKLKENK